MPHGLPPRGEAVGRDDSLNAGRRAADLEWLGTGPVVDVLVVGGGVTGTGVALDAASRGLSVLLVEKHDLAFGTSRWSSKLVHGGLRYLASGQVGIAYESAVERGILRTRTAPHLVRSLPMLLPFLPPVSTRDARLLRAGYALGDLLRAAAGTPATVLPRSRRVGPVEASALVPAVRRDGLRGGLIAWDGQLVDDARLVVAIARTAAGHGARIVTRCAATGLAGDGAQVRDELTGRPYPVRARVVINATGVWAGELVPQIAVRPSRGTHLVLPGRLLGGLRAQLTIPVPGDRGRFVFALPQPDGRVFAGLTDEPADGPVPDVPEPTEGEIRFLLDTLNGVLASPVDRSDVAGAYAGLRPLLDTGAGPDARSADLSRKHAVLTSRDGVITVVGGKLTTYRRMAQDAVDTAVHSGRVSAGPSRTARLALVGAAPPAVLATVDAPRRLVRRYGTRAVEVLAAAGGDPALLAPIAAGLQITAAELRHAIRHEGALDTGDLLDRRTRIGLVPADRARAEAAAAEALAAATATGVG
jgi:glycerol-3-phosphate dehydrogenase